MAQLVSTQNIGNGITLATFVSPTGGNVTLKVGGGSENFASTNDASNFLDKLKTSLSSASTNSASLIDLVTGVGTNNLQTVGDILSEFNLTNTSSSLGASVSSGNGPDHRVRIRAKPGMESEIYGSGPISILNQTNGMIFPYTPNIQYAQSVGYSALNLIHTNQDFNYFSNVPNLQLTIGSRFTAQNQAQAQYCFACIHFLRTVSKMRFGISDAKRGLPPPMLVLDGYGDHMFNQLPVYINMYSVELLQDVDYVRIPMQDGGEAWIPSDFSISISATVQNTPAQWRDQFNLDSFRNGQLLGSKKGWI